MRHRLHSTGLMASLRCKEDYEWHLPVSLARGSRFGEHLPDLCHTPKNDKVVGCFLLFPALGYWCQGVCSSAAKSLSKRERKETLVLSGRANPTEILVPGREVTFPDMSHPLTHSFIHSTHIYRTHALTTYTLIAVKKTKIRTFMELTT